jgi:hypothetical protein
LTLDASHPDGNRRSITPQSRNVNKVRYIQSMWALMQRIMPRFDQDPGKRAPLPLQKDQEEIPLELNDRSVATFLKAEASSSPPGVSGDDVSAARLQPLTPSESPRRAADMNASLDVLAEQMLTLVEVVSAQERDVKALKMRCQQLEEHDQAVMVAFTTFFHVLAAGHVARLEDIAAILHNIIKVAQHEAYPKQSIRFLQSLATMLQEQSSEGAPEVQTHDVPRSEDKD